MKLSEKRKLFPENEIMFDFSLMRSRGISL